MSAQARFLALRLMAPLLVGPVILEGQHTRITNVQPSPVKHGMIAAALGEGIDADKVSELYLTDGKVDILVEIVEQTAKSIKFKVPSTAKPGRWALMIKTKPDDRYLEQPVKLVVE